MIRTALVRNSRTKNLKILRAGDYSTQSEFAQDLRGNGYRVLKIWNENKSDSEVDNWELLNRKNTHPLGLRREKEKHSR